MHNSPHDGPVDELSDDCFITTVDLTPNTDVVFARYRHAGKEYVRWRLWHHHTDKPVTYPNKRRYGVIPLDRAEAFADAILQAVRGEQELPPQWLTDFDAESCR